jgi:hypothetical protein
MVGQMRVRMPRQLASGQLDLQSVLLIFKKTWMWR